MSPAAHLGVDIGTTSSKGVLVSPAGAILASAVREHRVQRPRPGHVEMDAEVWWQEFVAIVRELLAATDVEVVSVGTSGMGPCTLLVDDTGTALRPAILYGVDMRSAKQIAELTGSLGEAEITGRCGSALTSQSVGPKLRWIAENEPDVFAAARRLYMPGSYLVHKLTGEYVLDHHSASQCTPLYDIHRCDWYPAWWAQLCGDIEPPRLLWSNQQAGTVSAGAAAETGLPAGIPVVAGTVDAWAEAVSVDAHRVGDLMLMYGTTMFMVNTVDSALSAPPLWTTMGVFPASRNLAAGMATSGAITGWLRDLFNGNDYESLTAAAGRSGAGARGLLMLPYLAGERTPIADPDARGVLAGLTVSHTAGDIYRAALEATAFAVRHNLQAFRTAGGVIDRVVAVGGGTQGELWTQIVSDVTGLPQELHEHSIGASYGSAYLGAASMSDVAIAEWNPVRTIVQPAAHGDYEELYTLYRELYPATLSITHRLARMNRPDDAARAEEPE